VAAKLLGLAFLVSSFALAQPDARPRFDAGDRKELGGVSLDEILAIVFR
jgi:hypothetical protein